GELRGEAFFFSPPNPEAPKPKSWVGNQFSRFSRLIWMTMAVTLLSNVMATATPLFTMTLYDSVIPSGSMVMGMQLLVGALMAIVLDSLLRLQRARVLSYIGAKSERILGAGIFQRLLAMPASYTERVAVGVQVARIKSLEVIRDMFVGPLAFLYYDAPTTLFFLAVLAVISPGVIVFMLLLMLGLTLLGAMILPLLRRRTTHAGRLQGQRQAFLTEALSRIPILQGAHAEEIWYERYRDLSGKAILASFHVNHVTTLLSTMANLLTMTASVGVMAVTAKGVMAGTQTVGSVVAAMMLTWRIFAPIQTTFLGVAKMVQILNSLHQVDRLMEIKGERDAQSGQRAELEVKGAVAFSRVSFRYVNDAEPALVGVTFRIPPGSLVAVVGANGSGKSTLIKMILGLYTPQAGSVLIDDSDIRQVDPVELRQTVSYLPQTCDIFFGTVAQNLRLVNPVASDQELEVAAARAGLLQEIRNMPQGFETRLQESRSERLTAGFKQRLSLARAYLKRSSILLFDEPANHLDSESEKLFVDAMAGMRGSATIFVVTHRPSHMRMADVVLYLDGGYLRGIGSPDDVKKLLPQSFV
ncbi:MAG: ATP-binding cassette domain-containing protein, partial [Magnetococcales bacterium]|nr:ATP-binding cassette domain-containing protein [Magnetococcales bacterium]